MKEWVPDMKLRRYFKLAGMLLKFKLERQMIYSFNFWSTLLVDFTVFLIQIAVFSTIFLQVDSINGWDRYQLIFFVGTFIILDSLYMCTYFFGIIGIPDKIRTGKLDVYITKPINTLFFVSFESMDLGSILLTIPGIMMLVYSAGKLNICVTPGKIIGYIFLMIVMLVLMFDLMVILRSAAFWFTRVDTLMEFESEMVNFSFRVPGIVFNGLTKIIFYLVLPYGLIATIPTQFFTGVLNVGYWLLTIVVCTIFTFLSLSIWKMGLKHYGSAGS
jgi:ABC-2 type transport system permease protein